MVPIRQSGKRIMGCLIVQLLFERRPLRDVSDQDRVADVAIVAVARAVTCTGSVTPSLRRATISTPAAPAEAASSSNSWACASGLERRSEAI